MMIVIPERIKQFRKAARLKQKELANLVGISPAAISRYENGERSNIQKPVLSAIAKELHVSMEALLSNDSCEKILENSTVHVVELWIKRPYKVYIKDADRSMTDTQIMAAAIAQAIDSDKNLTLCDDMDIEGEDILSVEYQYDLDD